MHLSGSHSFVMFTDTVFFIALYTDSCKYHGTYRWINMLNDKIVKSVFEAPLSRSVLFSTVDPDSLNPDTDTDPDPTFQVNQDPGRIQCFEDQKFQKSSVENVFPFFDQKL
jgi:hypothetical protein